MTANVPVVQIKSLIVSECCLQVEEGCVSFTAAQAEEEKQAYNNRACIKIKSFIVLPFFPESSAEPQV